MEKVIICPDCNEFGHFNHSDYDEFSGSVWTEICRIDSIPDGCEDYPVYTVQLKKGDIFYIGTNRAFNRKYDINLNKIKLGDKCFDVTICIKKFKRKWWQFWKPRYTGAHFMVVDDI